jgi:polysaccharide biosynthesis protein PslH
MKLPCITSRLANNAINAKEGEEILIGNTPQEYSDCIIKLLHDQDFYHSISENAYSFVHRSFSWKESVSLIDRVISNKT